MKKCPKCGESKDLNCFGPDRRGPEGKNWICRDCKNFAQREFNQTPKGKYLSYKKGSKQRGYSFTLTMDEFMGFWNKSCFYCGDEIEGIGLDRVNNSIGYEIHNVISCCSTCNMMKWMTLSDFFISQCKKISEFHKS